MIICLIYLVGCNKIPWNEWLIDNWNLFLTILESEKSNIKAPADFVSGEPTF